MILANPKDTSEKESFDDYPSRSYLDCYSRVENTQDHTETSNLLNKTTSLPFNESENKNSMQTLYDGILDSPWPMYCHDIHHSGRSPYSTISNPPGIVKWRFDNDRIGALYGSSVVDINGITYFGGLDFFALYPNGTLKWQIPFDGWSESCPAIDTNGTIYLASAYGNHNYIYAFYPNGSIKWSYYTGNDIFSSPVIGFDGTIYCGNGQSILSLFSNGTLRWQHSTGHVVYSSPAIGDDGIVYCGCHDTYLYALYPNNGTVKWTFKTGDWIRVSPSIADDGTIYCVSLDGYLYAIRQNGTMKWRTNVGGGTSPTIGPDGTIYAGWGNLYAINPDGSVKWIYSSVGGIEGGTPCTSQEGIIYFGTYSGNLIAVNPDGTEAWKSYIGKCESAPAIGEDGTIYIGAMDNNSDGHLFAFGRGPLIAEANGPYNGYANTSLQFTGTIYGGMPPYQYTWDFGDGHTSHMQNPIHNYTIRGNYTATFTIVDSEGNISRDNTSVTIHYALPTITIIKPQNALYLFNIRTIPLKQPVIVGRITFQVDSIQEPYGIDRVEFSVNGELQHTDHIAPYTWELKELIILYDFPVRIVAYDATGRISDVVLRILKIF